MASSLTCGAQCRRFDIQHPIWILRNTTEAWLRVRRERKTGPEWPVGHMHIETLPCSWYVVFGDADVMTQQCDMLHCTVWSCFVPENACSALLTRASSRSELHAAMRLNAYRTGGPGPLLD